jgi:oligopeptide/dipeptide ABC transporter ATP-binding protein
MLITHSLGVVAEIAQRVVVMYAAKIVEEAPVRSLFKDPNHPYTRGLLTSIPRMDGTTRRLPVIPGIVPSPFNFPSGCRFHDRCGDRFERCASEDPPLFETGGGQKVRCWLYERSEDLHG